MKDNLEKATEHETKFYEMTDEEAEYWDDYYTKNPPKVDPAKARYAVRMVAVDDFTADYPVTKATVTRKSPTEIIGEPVRGELTRNAEPAWQGNSTARTKEQSKPPKFLFHLKQ